MKNYYQILGVPEDCSQADIKKAFRKLAFRYHPDTNPGNKQQAEEKFKEINEAYGVLGDKERRQQYDSAGKGQFAGIGHDSRYQNFGYSQQDIFQGIFSNPAMFDDMNRMFAQAGLRFDRDFFNQTFFTSGGMMFRVFTTPGATSSRAYNGQTASAPFAGTSAYKPNVVERFLIKILGKAANFVLSKLFGMQYNSLPPHSLDYHVDFEISPSEAAAGGEKQITYQRDGQTKTLLVKIPSGVKPGTKIRLKGMGLTQEGKSGDLYLHTQIKL